MMDRGWSETQEAELGPLPLYRVDGSEVLVAEVLETPVVVALLRHFG